MECDVCLEPSPGLFGNPGLPILSCARCTLAAVRGDIPFSAVADSLEIRRMGSPTITRSLVESECLKPHPPGSEPIRLTAEQYAALRGSYLDPATAPWPGEEPAAPSVAGVTVLAPDPAELPGPESNVIRVFQWPPHCGQWYVRIGAHGDRRSIQYGPLRAAAEVLEGFARFLGARGYRFDGGYEPPTAA